MRRILSQLATLLVFVLTVTSASAQQSEVTRYLINQPATVSMLTRGVDRPNIELKRVENELDDQGNTRIDALYHSDIDKIVITAVCYDCWYADEDEDACALVFGKIRGYSTILNPGAKDLLSLNTLLIGFHRNDVTDPTLDGQIMKVVQLEANIRHASKKTRCQAPLIGTGYFVQKP